METNVISVQPRNHFVIIKATAKMSTFMLASGNPAEADKQEPVNFEVAAIGNNVQNLQVGDKVILEGNAELNISVPENKKSRKAIQELYKDIFKDNKAYQELIKTTPKVEFVEYLLYPEFKVVAIIN